MLKEASGAVRQMIERRDRFGLALLGLAVLGVVHALALPLSDTAADLNMRRTHGRLWGPAWAALQLAPAMYHFENTALVYRGESDEAPLQERAVNHHVSRVVYERGHWRGLDGGRGCYRYVLRSRYRGTSLTTEYRACRSPAGVVVRRLDR